MNFSKKNYEYEKINKKSVSKNLSISLFVVVALLFSCKNNSQNKDKSAAIEVINPIVFKAKVDNETVQLIDVRRPEEFTAGHIKNSKNINVLGTDFVKNAETTLDKDKPVYLYCRSGKRSARASKALKEAGFTEIYDLEGGFLAWSKENLEIKK